MQVKFGGELLPDGTKYSVTGEQGTRTSENGIIKLQANQTATIWGILSGTTYEVKEIVKIKHNLTEKQIELAQWMAKRYFCNVSDCIKQMLTPGTKNKNAQNKVQDKIINVVYLKKEIDEIQFDIDIGNTYSSFIK